MVQPVDDEVVWWEIGLYNLALATILIAWGMYLGSRRELVWELNNRVKRAEAERDERSDRARESERARIAQEMHDVLGHRISQISMHAGALAFRNDLTPDQLREGASRIQDTANEALTDLRGVLGVLRDSKTGLLIEPPQPTYEDVPRLVEAAREAGMRIDFHDGLRGELPTAGGPHAVPDPAGGPDQRGQPRPRDAGLHLGHRPAGPRGGRLRPQRAGLRAGGVAGVRTGPDRPRGTGRAHGWPFEPSCRRRPLRAPWMDTVAGVNRVHGVIWATDVDPGRGTQ